MGKATDKISYLDGIRGVAAFVVFIHHFSLSFYPAYFFPDSGVSHLDGWDAKYGRSLYSVFTNGHFCVCIFFVLSGCVLSRKYFQSGELSTLVSGAQRRFVRLYIPTAVTILIAWILITTNCYRNFEVGKIANADLWLNGNILPPPAERFTRMLQCITYKTMLCGDNVFDTTMWTIVIEFYGSLFVFAFLALTHKTRNRFTMLSLIFMVAFFTNLINLAAFIFGISLNYVERRRMPGNKYFINGLAVLLLIVALLFGSYPSTSDIRGTFYAQMPKWMLLYDSWFHIVGGFFLVLSFVLSRGLQKLISLRIFRFLGYISFSLYLLHPLVIYTVSCNVFLLLLHRLDYNTNVIIVFIITTASSIFVSWLMTKYIDGPGIRLAKYLYDRWVRKPPVHEAIQSS